MASTNTDERIAVAITDDATSVVLVFGDVTVSVTAPTSSVQPGLTADKLRITLLANARRAVEMARSELE